MAGEVLHLSCVTDQPVRHPGIKAIGSTIHSSLSAGRGRVPMTPANRQLLQLVANTDNTLKPHEQTLLDQLISGQIPPADQPSRVVACHDGKLFLSAKEVAQRLNVGRTKFYELRGVHPELRPVHFGGKPQYPTEAILRLFERLQHNLIPLDTHAHAS